MALYWSMSFLAYRIAGSSTSLRPVRWLMTTISPVCWFNYVVCNFTMDFFKNVYTFLPENVDHSSTRFVVHRISQSFYFSVIFTYTKQLYLVANRISIVATSPISTTRVIRLVTRNSLLVSRHSNTELHKNHSVSTYLL